MTIEDLIALQSYSSDAATIDLTKPLRRALKAEFQRTGIPARLLLKERRDLPSGLDARTVNGWLRASPSARVDHLKFVCAMLAALPSATDCPDGIAHKSKSGPRGRDEPRIDVTPDMVARFRHELTRSGQSVEGLARYDTAPAGLTLGVLVALRRGSVQTVRADHWDFLIDHLSGQPDKSPREVRENNPSPRRDGYRKISGAEFHALRHEIERTGIPASKILDKATAPHDKLNGSMVKAWTLRQTVTALPEHIEFVLTLYRIQPDA